MIQNPKAIKETINSTPLKANSACQKKKKSRKIKGTETGKNNFDSSQKVISLMYTKVPQINTKRLTIPLKKWAKDIN